MKVRMKKTLRVFKADDWDYEEIRFKAEKFSNGNLSAWVRLAARNYLPKQDDKKKPA